jgi:hypothetical protein
MVRADLRGAGLAAAVETATYIVEIVVDGADKSVVYQVHVDKGQGPANRRVELVSHTQF